MDDTLSTIHLRRRPCPPATPAPEGAPCWIDLFTSDPDASRAFYGELFGWTSEVAGEEYGGYITFARDGVAVAGAMANDGTSGTPDLWSVYLATADLDSTAEKAAAHGGGVMVPPMDVGDQGRMAVLTDAGGAAVGAWQPGAHKGFGVWAETGAPSWFELHTRDHAATVRFYQDVFGWDTHITSDTDEFRYATLGQGDGQLAGVMDASAFLPEGVPAHWSIYFGVDDAEASLARIEELGGKVVLPAEDTPYGVLAQAADPTGALFKIVQ
ncbi:MAG TPA: VOC family protein [Acidimicrobiales bacterium]|nr:VOC family protein [Acidimicrobiales bacterium]